VVRKRRGFHDDEYMLGSYLGGGGGLLRKNKKEHSIYTRLHMHLGKYKLMKLADFYLQD
jgi:hypothetical protein